MASEFSTSEFMLTAKLLSDQIDLTRGDNDDFREDPNIPGDFFKWAEKKRVNKFVQLITKKGIFTQREIAKKTHLMHTLNIISSVIGGLYNRNTKAIKYLNDYAIDFPDRDELIELLEETAELIIKLKLKRRSAWNKKASIFTLIVSIATFLKDGGTIDSAKLKYFLDEFENNMPEDYKLAATEAVNSSKARLLRNRFVTQIIEQSA